jgi:hypothetical protein
VIYNDNDNDLYSNLVLTFIQIQMPDWEIKNRPDKVQVNNIDSGLTIALFVVTCQRRKYQ